MEKSEKKKIKIKKNFVIGSLLILISLNRIFKYVNISMNKLAFGVILIITGVFMLLPFIFPNFFKKFEDIEEKEQERPKPEVYFYSKPEEQQMNQEEQELNKKTESV